MKKKIITLVVAGLTVMMTGCMSTKLEVEHIQHKTNAPSVRQQITIMGKKELGTKYKIIDALKEETSYKDVAYGADIWGGNGVKGKKGMTVYLDKVSGKPYIVVKYYNSYTYPSSRNKVETYTAYYLNFNKKQLDNSNYKYTIFYPSKKTVVIGENVFGSEIDPLDSAENIQADFDNIYASLVNKSNSINAEFYADAEARKKEAERKAKIEAERRAKEAERRAKEAERRAKIEAELQRQMEQLK